MLMGPVELRPEEGCASDGQQKLKTTDPDFSSERATHINKSATV
jgi:hypothetical protein